MMLRPEKGLLLHLGHEQIEHCHEVMKYIEAKNKETSGIGSTFTRWGRQDCPGNGTDLVYSGNVGGGKQSDSGSAVNYLCLTKEPTWNHTDIISGSAQLYGAEYTFGSSYSSVYFGQNLDKHEPPCAVCRSNRASLIMIPGTNVCTEGWTREYAGYLVAGSSGSYAASEYICLDSSATTVISGGSSILNREGKEMNLVKAKCSGLLKCPPYVSDREVTCVVCTQ